MKKFCAYVQQSDKYLIAVILSAFVSGAVLSDLS